MARIRTIKPDFFTSLTIAGLSPERRLTFIGMWTHVDDEGRCVDDPRLIKAAVWPLDDRTAMDVEKDLGALSESSLITRYTVKQKRYMVVNGFREHQKINRPTASKLPGPDQADMPPSGPRPPAETQDSHTPHGDLTEDSPPEGKGKEGKGREQGERASADASGPPPSQPPAPSRPDGRSTIPDDFALNGGMRRWAVGEFGNTLDPGFETQQFIHHFRAEGTTRTNWYEAWKKWMYQSAEWKSQKSRQNVGADVVPLRRGAARAQEFADDMDAIAAELRAMQQGDTGA